MEMLGLKETVVQMTKANEVRWYAYVLRRDDGYILRKALEFEVKGKGKQEQRKETWKTQVEKEDATNREGGGQNSSKMESGSGRDCCESGVNLAILIYGDKPEQNWID